MDNFARDQQDILTFWCCAWFLLITVLWVFRFHLHPKIPILTFPINHPAFILMNCNFIFCFLCALTDLITGSTQFELDNPRSISLCNGLYYPSMILFVCPYLFNWLFLAYRCKLVLVGVSKVLKLAHYVLFAVLTICFPTMIIFFMIFGGGKISEQDGVMVCLILPDFWVIGFAGVVEVVVTFSFAILFYIPLRELKKSGVQTNEGSHHMADVIHRNFEAAAASAIGMMMIIIFQIVTVPLTIVLFVNYFVQFIQSSMMLMTTRNAWKSPAGQSSGAGSNA